MLRCKPTGTGFAFAPTGLTLLFCALLCALPALGGTTWDGGGANASWGTANNWNPNGLPLFDGTQTITIGTGFGSGTTLTLDGTRYLSSLVINTTTGFTISAGTGGTLNLRSGNLTRQDVAGTEAVQTISAGMILGDPTGVAAYTGTWNIAGSNSLDITGTIAEAGGSRGINKTGAGTVILSGTNTFSGGLTITAGTVSITSDTNLGASSGGLTFGGGTLQFADDVAGSRAIVMTSAGIFSGAFGKTLEESGAVSGNGNLTVAGSGTLILSGSGSNGTGSTTLSSGVLSLRGTVSLGSGNLVFTTGVLELGNGNFTRALGTGNGQVNMNSASGGAGFAAYGADRTVNLGGSGATVTWASGNFVANGQTLYLGTPTADHMVDFQNPINLNGASRTITVTDGAGTGVDAKISGVISGTGTSNLVMSTVGIAPWNPGSLLLSNGNNSYAGTTTINAGTLLLGANATGTAGNTVLGSSASDVLVGNTTGAFDAGLLTNGTVTISRNVRAQSGNTGSISIGGYSANASTFSGNIFLGTNAVATGKSMTLTAAAGGTVTFSGIIQDPTGVTTRGVVTKDGAGTVILSGVNIYAGSTIVNRGTLTLAAGGTGALGTTSSITVNSGGTLLLGASNQISNTAPMSLSGGTFAKGNFSEGTAGSAGLGALTLTASGSRVDFGSGTVGVLTFAGFTPGAFTLTIDNWTGTPGAAGSGATDRLIFASDQTANLSSFGFTGYVGVMEFDLGNGYYEITPVTAVPEPSTYVAAALALATMGFHQARRRRARSKQA
jgi:fibronectin-binding autotransporter adhesin